MPTEEPLVTFAWGIVGIGNHPNLFMAPAIGNAKGSRLAAVCSRDQERAEEFAARHNAAAAYATYDQLLRDPNVNGVYVASPNFLHCEHVVKAAEAGKHVLCEKPMALSVEDGERMVEAADRAGVTLSVGFHLRHHPAHQEMRRRITLGEAGKLVTVQAMWSIGKRGLPIMEPREGLRGWWNDPELVGGGGLFGTGVHTIDLVRFILGDEVAEVFAFTDQGPEQPLDLVADVLLRLRGGATASVKASRIIPDSQNDFVVYGNSERLAARDTASTALQGTLEVASESGFEITSYTKGDLFVSQVEDFVEAIDQKRPPLASGVDGLRNLQVHLGVYEAARTGRAVVLPG
jgi:1,5-anhydro-D-fructose reductase (1,5-anhydro-D-mannitol-forming)